MKKIYNITALILIFSLSLPCLKVNAGNEDRSGQAGASELLINPWSRSAGWGGANTANVHGLESIFTNVAGTAFTNKTELIFSRTNWLQGSGVYINSFGLCQRLNETGVLSLAVTSMTFGDIQITTVDLPEGGVGTFSPNLMNISLGYAKSFSNSIYGGLTLKIISESVSDVTAQGIALDAGIQYVTGETENIKFGIVMKNVGPRMRFKGDGLSFRGYNLNSSYQSTVEQRSADYELPSLICIGASYDFTLSESQSLTAAANFTSNSFIKDQYSLGLEYGLKSYLKLRGGFCFEKGILSDADRTTVFTGPSAGFTVDVPLNKEKGSKFGLDYSYRFTNPFDGVHGIGIRITL